MEKDEDVAEGIKCSIGSWAGEGVKDREPLKTHCPAWLEHPREHSALPCTTLSWRNRPGTELKGI